MLGFLLKRPVSIWISALALVVLGGFSLWRLPLSLLPTLERPQLKVTLVDADLSRHDMLQQVVIPLERRLRTLDGVVDVRSWITDGEAVVRLDTEWQTDVDRLRIEAQQRLVEASSTALDEMTVEVEAGDPAPILSLAVMGGSAHQRTSLAEKVLVPELGRLTGAGEIEVFGSAHLRPVVTPRGADLAVRGLTAADVAGALQSVGRNRPLGRVRDGALIRHLIVRQEVERLEDLASLPVSAGEGVVSLSDVADVTLDEVPDHGLFHYRGRPGLLLEVYRAPGANAVHLAREGREAVRQLAARSGRMQLVWVADRSREVVGSLLQLAQAGGIGLLFGTFILRFMLGSWRPTLALVVVVPVSIVAAFSAFFLFGVSLDIISLAGLALAAGMLVDNSIVVLESIAGAAEQGNDQPVTAGTEQIAMPLVAGFLTTAVVFLPLIYLRGLARAFFGVQAFAIVSTLAISLAVSLTLTPLLSRRSASDSTAVVGRSPGRETYLRLLGTVVRRPRIFSVISLGLALAVALMTLPWINNELMPEGAAKGVVVDVDLPAALGPEKAEERLSRLESLLAKTGTQSERAAHWVFRGRADGRRSLADRAAVARIEIAAKADDDLAVDLQIARRAVASVPGLQGEARPRGSTVSSMVDVGRNTLELELSAATAERLQPLAGKVETALAAAGLMTRKNRSSLSSLVSKSVESNAADQSPAWSLSWDPIQLAGLQVDEQTLVSQVVPALGGVEVGRGSIEGTEPEIRLRPTRVAELEQLPLQSPAAAGRWFPLGAVADVERHWTPAAGERRNGRPVLRQSLDLGLSRAAEVEAVISDLPLAADEQVQLVGQTQEIRRSFEQLGLALSLALVLVFLTVAALYESLAMPWVVMVTVPVAAVGGLAALAITGQSLNVMSFLGLILLSGIVVNNAIVLVHRAEQLLAGLGSQARAIEQAASERFRPILMTTLTTLMGMVPLALLAGEGLELRRALATTVSGGLVTSWAAALLVVPALYLALGRGERR